MKMARRPNFDRGSAAAKRSYKAEKGSYFQNLKFCVGCILPFSKESVIDQILIFTTRKIAHQADLE